MRDAGLSAIGRMLVGPYHTQDSLLASHPESRAEAIHLLCCAGVLCEDHGADAPMFHSDPTVPPFSVSRATRAGFNLLLRTRPSAVDGVDNTGNICGWARSTLS